MNPLVISIDWPYFLGIMGGLIGIAWYSNGRFTKLETDTEWIKDLLKSLKINTEGKLNNSFGEGSPIRLFPKGDLILNDSGLKKYIDENKQLLLLNCKSESAMDNQYDIQESVFNYFDKYDFGDFEQSLKTAAFNFGVSLETVKRIGGIYFRDICLAEHGFKPEDLDVPKIKI